MMMTMTWRESAGAGNLWEVSRRGPRKDYLFRVLTTSKVSSILVREGNEAKLFSDEHTSGNLTQEKILGKYSSSFHMAI